MNGEKANDEYLAPGCTAYDSWIQYQTYDVTDLVHTGENVIGAILGNGWAKGRFGFDGVVGDYGDRIAAFRKQRHEIGAHRARSADYKYSFHKKSLRFHS